MKKYEYLEHPADLKIRAFGGTLSELFINSALAITNFLYKIEKTTEVKIEIIELHADGVENLLVNWLAEILFLSDANHLACVDFKIKNFTETKLTAEICMAQAYPKDDIKAITYSELAVNKTAAGWEAIFVCDI